MHQKKRNSSLLLWKIPVRQKMNREHYCPEIFHGNFFKRTFIIFINISSYYYLGWGCFFISSVKLKYDNRLFVWLYVFCTRFVLTRFKTQNWALYRLIFIRKKKTLNDTLLCWYFQLVTYIYTDCSTCVLFVIYDMYYFLWEANLFYHTTFFV